MVVVCQLCGRTFRTAQGRRGHLNFYHGLAKDTPIIKAIRWRIDRHNAGMKMLEEEEIKNGKRREEKREEKGEEKREKAMGALREYERSMGATEDNKFIDKVEFE